MYTCGVHVEAETGQVRWLQPGAAASPRNPRYGETLRGSCSKSPRPQKYVKWWPLRLLSYLLWGSRKTL